MADLLPALSSDDENEKFDDEDDDENEEVDIVFGGLLVSLYRHLIFCESEVGMKSVHDGDPIKFANLRFYSFFGLL
jgi:hypothetical protein